MDTDVIKTAVTDALSCDEKNKYYVYALCEKTSDNKLVPFYIGKGEGSRVWAHEEGYEKDSIKKNSATYQSDEVSKELTEKYKKIEDIRNRNGEIEKIIIKWGMTNEEAFMAESALINLLKIGDLSFDSTNRLTNIANGHASVGEKNSLTETKARTIEQFYDDCAKEPVNFGDLYGKKIVLISINKGYPQCVRPNITDHEEAIKDMACGFWKLSDKRKPEYLFAMYRQTIVGIYKIDNTQLINILDISNKYYPHNDELPIREKDYSYAEKIVDAEGKNGGSITEFSKFGNQLQEELKEFWGKHEDYQKCYKNWRQRKCYVLEKIDASDTMKQYLGRRIIEYKTDENGKEYTTSPIPARNYIRYTDTKESKSDKKKKNNKK